MTESAFPFPAQPQGDAVAAPVEEPVDSRRRKVFLAGGAALLVVLLAAVYFLFLKGGSSTDEAFVVKRATPSKAAAAGAKAAPKAQTIPQTFDASVGRDPFKPLLEPPPPAPVAAPVTGATATTGTAATGTAPASTPVALQKVYQQNGKTYAQLTVNGAVYAPTVGQTFASTFQLMSVKGRTATLVQGDEQFSLSVGQVVTR